MPELIKFLPNDEQQCRATVLDELNANRKWHKCIEEKIDENTALTREFVDILRACQGGLKFLGWMGVALKWVAGIAAALYTLYCIYKGKNPFL